MERNEKKINIVSIFIYILILIIFFLVAIIINDSCTYEIYIYTDEHSDLYTGKAMSDNGCYLLNKSTGEVWRKKHNGSRFMPVEIKDSLKK